MLTSYSRIAGISTFFLTLLCASHALSENFSDILRKKMDSRVVGIIPGPVEALDEAAQKQVEVKINKRRRSLKYPIVMNPIVKRHGLPDFSSNVSYLFDYKVALSVSEIAIMRLLLMNRSDEQIASFVSNNEKKVSKKTVQVHSAAVRKKLGLKSREAINAFLFINSMVDLTSYYDCLPELGNYESLQNLENRVLKYIAMGLGGKQIAALLDLSIHTVEVLTRHVKIKVQKTFFTGNGDINRTQLLISYFAKNFGSLFHTGREPLLEEEQNFEKFMIEFKQLYHPSNTP